MTRYLRIAALAACTAAAQPAAAQGGHHPLVGTWRVEYAGPVATASEPVTGTLTIAEQNGQMTATLQTPSARSGRTSTEHRLRGVVVGDEAEFVYTAPMRVEEERGSVLRDVQVRWRIGVRHGSLVGSQLRVVSQTSEVLTETDVLGTRIGG